MNTQKSTAAISVIMPTFNHGAFISRAIISLLAQSYENWELIIINDGALDDTFEVLAPYLSDQRIIYLENKINQGLGAALNKGLDNANSNYIAYLPSDDIFYRDHLHTLYNLLENEQDSLLAVAGMKCFYEDGSRGDNKYFTQGKDEKLPLQLVQVLHRNTKNRWITRQELVTDDLSRMFWDKLLIDSKLAYAPNVTCEWVDHPSQRHKIINEKYWGGIYLYKQFYNVKDPIVFQSSGGNLIDEPALFSGHNYCAEKRGISGLKILLVGELSYNPERLCALEKQGHTLYGLWIKRPGFWNASGPLPFGNITEVSYDNWIEEVKAIKPDIIYALLNWPAVELAHSVLEAALGIPFVWHFKEGPFFCRQLGLWKQLINLFAKSDGQIYTNNETKAWFEQFLPDANRKSIIIDGDLPSMTWFSNEKSALLSDIDGEVHTVVPGRPFGISPNDILGLAEQKIHLHFYGNVNHQAWEDWIKIVDSLAPRFLHIHPHCSPDKWVSELSQYDAGWLHFFRSENNGEFSKITWNDLNYPSRMATLAAAGLPMLQRDNSGHIVATQALTQQLEIGIHFNEFSELGVIIRDRKRMAQIRQNVEKHKSLFCFDYHVENLILFFNEIILNYNK